MGTGGDGDGSRVALTVLGASGFTGQFVVEEVARVQLNRPDLSWAIAGRSRSKLDAVRRRAEEETGADLSKVKLMVVDVNDAGSLKAMAAQSRVVLNCVGPYRFFGDQVVKACVENSASHVDISGEPQFLERTQLHQHDAAAAAGVYVVGACGFDSIPADMGVTFLLDKFDGDLNGVESYFEAQIGPQGYRGIHYATYQSAIHGFANQAELGPLRRKLFGQRLPKPSFKLPVRGNMHYSDVTKSYCLPFMGSDKSVVQRSVFYNYHHNAGRNVQYTPYVAIGNLFQTIMVAMLAVIFGAMASFSWGRSLLEKYPRLFTLGKVNHEGPTRAQMADAAFSMTLVANGWSKKLPQDQQHIEKPDRKMVAKVSGPECGYVATPICMVQCGLTILDESDKMPGTGGVFAPGAAFASTSLIKHLNENGVRFDYLSEQ